MRKIIIDLRPKNPPSITFATDNMGGFVILVKAPGDVMDGLEMRVPFSEALAFIRMGVQILNDRDPLAVLSARVADYAPGINMRANNLAGFDLVYVAEGHKAHGTRLALDRNTSTGMLKVASAYAGITCPDIHELPPTSLRS